MTGKKTKKGKTTPVDAMVGARVRLRRTMLGITQEQLAVAVGLTFQQVQKYERGMNRMGASRLLDFSRILDVPVNYFFDDGILETPQGFSENGSTTYQIDPFVRRDTMELIRAYLKIPNEKIRKRLLDLAKALTDLEEQTTETPPTNEEK